jgi:hypothetical protein
MRYMKFSGPNNGRHVYSLQPNWNQSIGVGLALTALAGCGGSDDAGESRATRDRDTASSGSKQPNDIESYFMGLGPPSIQPYWTSSLIMSKPEQTVVPMLNSYSRIIEFSFPIIQPEYEQIDVLGWQPSTWQMKVAAREIFEKLGSYLDVTFVEVADPLDRNVIALATSKQTDTTGFAYFPNPDFELGMDVFISEDYSRPRVVSLAETNYDYQVLLHEIGHALGLKHPFEADGENRNVLSPREDESSYTVMSYNASLTTFSGDLRVLDLMALAELYGVNPSFNAGDNIYEFSNKGGKFIIDGGGTDSIIYRGNQDAFLDLRSGGHSYLDEKSAFISAPKQLTISQGSQIENATTGSGDDVVIGNESGNVLITAGGDDYIFAGEGGDVITSGAGSDIVDLSEDVPAPDLLNYTLEFGDPDFDVIGGFSQGSGGDQLNFKSFFSSVPILTPLINTTNVPNARIDNSILRIVGNSFDTPQHLDTALSVDGVLSNLSLSAHHRSLFVAADTQATGEDQRLFAVYNTGDDLTINQLAVFQGGHLDINSWMIGNFSSDFIT